MLQHMATTAIGRSAEELLDKIGFASTVETRATDDTVSAFAKLSAAHSVVEIETVWGFGFRIKKG